MLVCPEKPPCDFWQGSASFPGPTSTLRAIRCTSAHQHSIWVAVKKDREGLGPENGLRNDSFGLKAAVPTGAPAPASHGMRPQTKT